MFGYVKLYPEQLRPVDAREYRRVYCGLCHQMGHYSPFCRMFLSFDMTFLIFLSAYDQRALARQCTAGKCLRRIPCPDQLMDYWACLSIMMVYEKHLNDLKDGRRISRLFLRAMEQPWKKACRQYPAALQAVREALRHNDDLEAQQSPDAEALACTFGQLAAWLIAHAPSNPERDAALEQVLENIARLIGEWIYLIDFYDDAEADLRHQQYNPMLVQVRERQVPMAQVRLEFREMIDRRVEELQRLCGFLPYSGYQAVVKNVIHEGVVRVTGNIYSGLDADGHMKKRNEKDENQHETL